MGHKERQTTSVLAGLHPNSWCANTREIIFDAAKRGFDFILSRKSYLIHTIFHIKTSFRGSKKKT